MRINPSEITPKHLYVSRRAFLKSMGIVSASALVLAACGGKALSGANPAFPGDTPEAGADAPSSRTGVDELGNELTSFDDITHYNNFYEFSTRKEAVADLSEGFTTSPWTVTVGGLVNNPKTYDVDELIQKFAPEERVYRLRCVEGWSMVIPWTGFPLQKLLAEVEPKSEAQYVRFEALYDLDRFPGQKSRWYEWPYIEGLRLDEAMNDLTLLATGLYGEALPPQNGAPLRLVVPWKYGFKSIKSIVKIDLVDTMPISLWMRAAPNEYGFFSNVNPDVPHPRWSQSTERRIGELGRRKTLPFNGYADQVAYLYAGMDLTTPNDEPYHPLARSRR